MNKPLGFEQDGDAPPGTGTFHFEDGSKIYAMDQELAGRLSQRLDATAPPRLAQNDPAQAALLSRLQSGAPAPDPLRALNDGTAAAPRPPSANPGWLAAMQGADAGVPDKFQVGGPKPAAPAPIGPPLPPGGVQQPAPAAPAAPPIQRPMVHVAGRDPLAEARNAVAVPTKSSTTLEASGRPWSPEDAALRERANQGVLEAKMAEFGAMKSRADLERAQAERDLPIIQQQADEAKRAQQVKYDAYAAERDRIRQQIERFDEEAKVDPQKFWRQGFGGPAALMLVGQALGAYAATLRGGDNWAQRTVEAGWKADLEAQREDIQQGRVGQQNMLAKLQDQLGDAQQAESAWKIMASELHERRIQAYAAEAKSQDADLAAQAWIAQNRESRLREEQKFMDLSMGKQTTTTSADMVTPRQGYSRPMTDDEMIAKQLKSNKLRGDLVESENRLGYEQRGGKFAQENVPDAELYVEGYGQAKSKKEAILLRNAIAENEAQQKELDRLEKLNKSGWSAVGFKVPFTDIEVGTDDYLESGVRSNRAVTKEAASRGGPITESDTNESRKVTADPRKIIGNEQIKIDSARDASNQALSAKINQIISGNHPELEQRRKVEEE